MRMILNSSDPDMAASTIFELDRDMKKGLANADYQKIIDLLGNKTDRSKGEDTMLKTAYNYMMFYNINKGDKNSIAEAKSFAEKILVIDPENETAKKIKDL